MSSTVNLANDLSQNFYNGVVTVGTAEVQVLPNKMDIDKGVQVKADAGNSGVVHIGRLGSTTTNAFPLSAGEGLFIPCSDVTKIYAIADAASQTLYWFAI